MTKSVYDYIPRRQLSPDVLYLKRSSQAAAEFKGKIQSLMNQLVTEYQISLNLEKGLQTEEGTDADMV